MINFNDTFKEMDKYIRLLNDVFATSKQQIDYNKAKYIIIGYDLLEQIRNNIISSINSIKVLNYLNLQTDVIEEYELVELYGIKSKRIWTQDNKTIARRKYVIKNYLKNREDLKIIYKILSHSKEIAIFKKETLIDEDITWLDFSSDTLSFLKSQEVYFVDDLISFVQTGGIKVNQGVNFEIRLEIIRQLSSFTYINGDYKFKLTNNKGEWEEIPI